MKEHTSLSDIKNIRNRSNILYLIFLIGTAYNLELLLVWIIIKDTISLSAGFLTIIFLSLSILSSIHTRYWDTKYYFFKYIKRRGYDDRIQTLPGKYKRPKM